ncbi:MAG TPA: helix-turn-helix domain-containing protein [Bacteroidales bacterium]|nr:helix-turn-helix domain-containing protein [Bacteroidales bacterium]HPT11118.1 helix-turn-helix domain-containing protein [Bacteroidales bacterium]
MSNSIEFFIPSEGLSNFIRNYYIAEFTEQESFGPFEQRQISDGCIEMFIGYQNTRSKCFDSDGNPFIADSGIVGAHNLECPVKGLAIVPGYSALKFVSINFKQHGFLKIFNLPGTITHNNIIDSSMVLGNDIRILQEQLGDARSNQERIEYVEKFLITNYIRSSAHATDTSNGFRIASFINYKNGNVKLKDLESEFRISERSLQRKFKADTGYHIKEYSKIVRFYNLLDSISSKENIVWSDMVSRYGYYDQPHMINEFREATGLSPDVYRRNLNINIFRLYNHLVIADSKIPGETTSDGINSSVESLQDESY